MEEREETPAAKKSFRKCLQSPKIPRCFRFDQKSINSFRVSQDSRPSFLQRLEASEELD